MNEHDHEHAPSRGLPIVLALAGLLALTVTSWLLSHVLDGGAATAVALAIAACKASIVGLVFMDLAHASVPMRVTALVTLAFIAILCAGVVADVDMR